MINILKTNDKNILAASVQGKLEKTEIENAVKMLERKVKENGKVRLYAEIKDIDLMEGLKADLKYGLEHPETVANIEKVAVVTDSEDLKKAFNLEVGVIPTLKGKTFSFGEKDEAMQWLKKDHRAAQQMDLIFPEVVEFGTVKAIGGFALGLLAANYLSKDQRKGIGAAALAGSFILGLPLAAKMLNNNRQLLGK